MELSQNQLLILEGKICPYCKGETKFVDSKVIYKKKSFGMIYLCEACDAYVGTHKGTEKALGRLANKNLRYLKKEAHKYFDIIWQEKHEKRNKVYYYLSLHLKIPQKYTHIGYFSEKTCLEVINWSKMVLNDMRRLDMDFGVDVKRPHYNR